VCEKRLKDFPIGPMTPGAAHRPLDLDEYELLFREALRIRRVEERIAEVYPTDKIQSPVHLSIGQEHISVGVCRHLERSDLVYGTYRGHALYLAKGGDLRRMIAELYGKATGCGAGKAGSMHLSDSTVGMMGASAIVASTIPHAVGSALAAKLRGSGQLTVCFFGEGATGAGVYHESLNFAAVRRLPILFVCENNSLAIHSRVPELHAFDVAVHAAAFSIRAEKIEDGMDLQEISGAARRLTAEIRHGGGPRLLEIRTYRYRQHVGPLEDYDLGYRDRSELVRWQSRDPLIQRADLVDKFDPAIQAEIDDAFAFAEASAFPAPEDLFTHVG
jgi:pyruvate dehydrogenase E1 component alpha subunit